MQITCMLNKFVKTLRKNLGEYHNLCLKTATLLLAYVFEDFRKKCLENYQLKPAKIYFSPQIILVKRFKKDGSKTRTIN